MIGDRYKARKELAALDKGVRRKPLERKANGQRAARIIFWLAVVVLVLLFALFWTQPGLVQY